MSRVAKLPQTLQELLNNLPSPDDLVNFPIEDLKHMEGLLKGGTTKVARLQLDMISSRIKQMEKGMKKAEPVANSTKATTKETEPVKEEKQAAKKPVSRKRATSTTASAGKAKTTKAAAGAPKKAGANTTKAKPPRGSTKQEENIESDFEHEIRAGNSVYKLQLVKSVEDLAKLLVEHVYNVFIFMDEMAEDGNLTQFIVTYASEQCILIVDKSRKKETFMHMTAEMIEANAYIMEEGERFPFAVYVRESIK